MLELALREALSLGHNYIGTEHILLGLLRENEGVAARILLNFDADAQDLHERVLAGLDDAPDEASPPREPPPRGRFRGRRRDRLRRRHEAGIDRSNARFQRHVERYTAQARQVVVLAQEEARILKHNYIGTEHILLGLLCEEEGLPARILEPLDITVERVRAHVVRIVGSGEEVSAIKNPEQTTDQQTQEPIVTMIQFSDAGRRAFAALTKRTAQRGADAVLPPGVEREAALQRFAIALDNVVVTLATIDFRENPEGIDGRTGVQINGIGSVSDARRVARQLKADPLPGNLVPLSPP